MNKKDPPEREPKVVDAESLNKFLMGAVTGIKTKEVTIEEADAISKISDKIIKLNLTRIMYKKEKKSELPIDFFETSQSQTLISKA